MKTTALIALSWRALLRDWRGGELKVLAIALIIAVTCVSAVGFFYRPCGQRSATAVS